MSDDGGALTSAVDVTVFVVAAPVGGPAGAGGVVRPVCGILLDKGGMTASSAEVPAAEVFAAAAAVFAAVAAVFAAVAAVFAAAAAVVAFDSAVCFGMGLAPHSSVKWASMVA